MALAYIALDALEEEYQAQMHEGRIHRRRLRDNFNPFEMPDNQFEDFFRVSKELANDICSALRPHLERKRSHGLPVEVQVLSTIRFYATGSYQKCVGQDFFLAVSQPVMSRNIKKVTDALNDSLFRRWVKFPATLDERLAAKQSFSGDLHGTIGAIDCTHVSILAPKENEEAYVNHHGFHSLNVQMVCHSDLTVINVNSRYPGSRHDSSIWMQCPARTIMQMWYNRGERRTWLIGDSGYPLEPWLLTPIHHADPATPDYNYTIAHCKARSVIERVFGIIKSTWRCLSRQRILMYDAKAAGRIVNACVTLHNMRLHYRLPHALEIEQHELDQGLAAAPQNPLEGRARHAEGQRVRQTLINEHFRL